MLLLWVFEKSRPNAKEILTRLKADPELKKQASFYLRRYRKG